MVSTRFRWAPVDRASKCQQSFDSKDCHSVQFIGHAIANEFLKANSSSHTPPNLPRLYALLRDPNEHASAKFERSGPLRFLTKRTIWSSVTRGAASALAAMRHSIKSRRASSKRLRERGSRHTPPLNCSVDEKAEQCAKGVEHYVQNRSVTTG
jgi:hypothetical protein